MLWALVAGAHPCKLGYFGVPAFTRVAEGGRRGVQLTMGGQVPRATKGPSLAL